MEYYGNNDWRDYHLAHHGILGQEWGKKNGPPYPLSDSSHSASEKKAGWKTSLASVSDLRRRKKSQKKYSKDVRRVANSIYPNKHTSLVINNRYIYNEKGVKESDAVKKVHKDLEKARNKYFSSFVMEKEYRHLNEKDRAAYETQAADLSYKNNKTMYDKMGFTNEDVRDAYKEGVIYDYSPLDLYIKSRGVDVEKYHKQGLELTKEYRSEVKKAVDDLVGRHGKKRLSKKVKNSPTISSAITEALWALEADDVRAYVLDEKYDKGR